MTYLQSKCFAAKTARFTSPNYATLNKGQADEKSSDFSSALFTFI